MDPLERIVSGGQTGVDRGALDAAIDADVAHGGWCPAGHKAEDGVISERYGLVPISSPDYSARTAANVRDSDGTLILCFGPLSGGTKLTHQLASGRKPVLVIDLQSDTDSGIDDVCRWIAGHDIRRLNVAGPRESTRPGIQDQARQFIGRLLSSARGG